MKKHALLIGVNQYHLLGNLSYARQDADSFAEMLKKRCSFSDSEITLMTCCSSGATLANSRYIEYAMVDLTECRDLDLLIFGFWGHGFSPERGKRYLCGVDTVEKDLERTAVSLDLTKAKLGQVGAMNTLLILDCCQNRPAGRAGGTAVLEEGAELQLASMARDIQAAQGEDAGVERVPTVAIMNSCREGQKAYEWDDRQHGVFTAHLLDGIKSGKTSIAQLSTYVCDHTPLTVRKLYRERQVPWFTIEGRGDILLWEEKAEGPLGETVMPVPSGVVTAVTALDLIKSLSRDFFSEEQAGRRASAEAVAEAAMHVDLASLVALCASADRGERVAGFIGLASYLRSGRTVPDELRLVNVLKIGLQDQESRVRYRTVQATGEHQGALETLEKELRGLAQADENEAVRELAQEMVKGRTSQKQPPRSAAAASLDSLLDQLKQLQYSELEDALTKLKRLQIEGREAPNA